MNSKIYEYIILTMQKLNINKDIVSVSNNINMTYNYLTDEISFDSKRIAQNVKHYPHISLKDYVTTFTLHELGHSLDQENLLRSYDQTLEWYEVSQKLTAHEKKTNSLYLELSYMEDKANLNFEKVAWINANHLNNQYNLVSSNVFNELKADSLLTYEKVYERSKEVFNLQKKIPMPL